MIVRILGSAAGGGVPQWNCACANCSAARTGAAPRRSQSGAAVSADGVRWLLLNCSPDIAGHIEAFVPLQPAQRRGTPIAGIVFTDANVDHLGGLSSLRQHGTHRFTIRSTAVVRAIATDQPAFAPFASPPHRWLTIADGESFAAFDETEADGAPTLRALHVPGTTPGYAGRRSEPGAVVAYELVGGERRVLFAPVFAATNDALQSAIERADVAVLDGSFFSDDELIAGGLADKTARSLGHLPVGGDGGTLERLRGIRTRIVFTHLNNSNPMLDPSSPAAEEVRAAGAEIAHDGMTV